MSKEKKTKMKKALSFALNILIYVFCGLCLVMLVFTIFGKRDVDGAVKFFGREMRIVTTSSMEKNDHTDVSNFKIKDIKAGSMVFIQLVPEDEAKAEEWYAALKVGDVLTFRYVVALRQETVTHRIIDIQPKESGGYIITLRGDNLSESGVTQSQIIDTSEVDSPNYVLGKVTGKNFLFGYFIAQLRQPLGLSLLIIVPCTIIIISQVIRIVNVLNANKRKKAEEEVAQRLSEMDELKRRIAELENESVHVAENTDGSGSTEATNTD